MSRFASAFSDKPYLRSLRQKMDDATVVAPKDIPPDVVTMNSTVRLRQHRSQDVETYTLVYPEDADIAEGKLSVLAPIGTAILGCRVGDRAQWEVPSGLILFRIEELVFQPERDGALV
ncbi:MAG: nucleoside diphosphate kinase regulator, partial [Maioricimonas sp. JB049]